MEQNTLSDPAHNLYCSYRFTCGSEKCPGLVAEAARPPCHVDKFKRYQPESDNCWYYRSWEEVNRITWREVFSFQESWIYALLLIIIIVFLFLSMTLVSLLLGTNTVNLRP
jgi:hypothetical protein